MNAGGYVTGSQLKKLGEYYAKAIHSTYGDDFDVLFGPAYKGIPLGVVTAIAYSELYGKEVRYCSDRKEAKDHGADKGNFLGSELKDGDRVIMIEDVTTSGKSMEETVPKVKGAANVEIVGLMVSLNRMEIGKGGEKCALDEVKELYGFDTAAIVDMEEVVECLYNKECNGKVVIDDTLKAAIDAYYEQYGAKTLRMVLVTVEKKKLARRGIKVIFYLYIIVIFYFVLLSERYGRDTGYDTSHVNLVLFKEINRFWTYRHFLFHRSSGHKSVWKYFCHSVHLVFMIPIVDQ